MTLKDQVQLLSNSQAAQTEILKNLKEGMDEIKQHIVGNPKEGAIGLITRVDRLEIWDKSKNKVLWLLGGTIAGGVFSWLVGKY